MTTHARSAPRAALEGHEGDLWVFGYGSLIWDPALEFAEVRRAFAPNHRRRFILEDIYGGRGTPNGPGLMAALDDGDGCNGLCFRIAAAARSRRRPRSCSARGTGTRATSRPSSPSNWTTPTDGADLPRRSFHRHDQRRPDARDADPLPRHRHGFSGHELRLSPKGVVDHLHEMDIPDPDLDALWPRPRPRWRAAPQRLTGASWKRWPRTCARWCAPR
jgi:hypothetical protein